MSQSKKLPPEIQAIFTSALLKANLMAASAYVIVFLSFALWSGLNHTKPVLFQFNLFIFIIELLASILLWHYVNADRIHQFAIKTTALIQYFMVCGLHWGVLTAYIIYACDLPETQQYMMRIITASFAGVAGNLWAFSNPVGVVFSAMMIVPHLVASYWFNDPNAHFYALLTSLLLIFLFLTSRNSLRTAFLQFISEYSLIQVHADSMNHLSKLDFATKWLNRFYFSVAFDSLWAKANALKNPLSLICFQMDEMKVVNMQHGHHIGDALIGACATFLKDALNSKTAVLGRYDSNRLMIALPGTNLEQANDFAASQCQRVREKILFPQQLSVPLNCSYHVISTTNHTGTTSQTMIDALITEFETKS